MIFSSNYFDAFTYEQFISLSELDGFNSCKTNFDGVECVVSFTEEVSEEEGQHCFVFTPITKEGYNKIFCSSTLEDLSAENFKAIYQTGLFFKKHYKKNLNYTDIYE